MAKAKLGKKLRPLIGINLDFEMDPFPRSVLRDGYYDAVVKAGGCPVLLPPIADEDNLAAALRPITGIVLTGGDDLDPSHFGEEAHPSCKLLPKRRQEFDLLLARTALEQGIPTLAICCGMQTVNVVRGGALVQDIPTLVKNAITHSTGQKGVSAEHDVLIEPDSHLADMVGTFLISANSAHHQCCGRLGRNLRVSARATDGVIEAFEDPDYPFLVGVQWHPERIADRPEQLHLFVALVGAARAIAEHLGIGT